MKSLFHFLSLTIVALVAGCATVGDRPSGKSDSAATCEVCRYRNDLACVCVKVTPETPRTEFQGSTYYFCIEECRTAFLKKPAKYAR